MGAREVVGYVVQEQLAMILLFVHQVAGDEMFPAIILQSRLDLVANVHSVLASCMEPASLWWIDWRGHVTLEDDAAVLVVRIGHRYSR